MSFKMFNDLSDDQKELINRDQVLTNDEWNNLSDAEKKRLVDFALLRDLLDVPEIGREIPNRRKWKQNDAEASK